jgi:lambda family phage portal protein
MGLFATILGAFSAPRRVVRQAVRVIRAGYDAARTTDDNRKHWAAADQLSANASMSPLVRQTIRSRARYEVANNCYAAGLVRTVANDLIGTGPTLQVAAPEGFDAAPIERQWESWAKAAKLARKLRCMRQCLSRDGEAFAVLVSNPKINHPIKLDLRLVEADQVTTPGLVNENAVDGIVFNAFGNPETYHILRTHPGDVLHSMEVDEVDAAYVIHWFRLERPGQKRGVSIIAPALPLFSKLRRYTLAVLGAAEAAAMQAGVLYTDGAPDDGESVEGEAFEAVEFERNMFTTLPGGYRLEQLKAEQPTTTYSEFKAELIDEAARCENVPSNIARGNSSAYNYASGRLDNQMFGRAQHVDHSEVEEEVIDRIFAAWLDEAAREPGVIPDGFPPLAECTHQWIWEGREHVDPNKEANAQATRLANLTTSLAEEWANRGKDWEAGMRQIHRERALLGELGLALPDSTAVTTAASRAGALSDLAEQAAVPAGGGR